MIQFVQIEICEKLGRKIADGNAFCFGVVRCIAFNNELDEPEDLFVSNVTMDQNAKNGMIDVRKELRDIAGKAIERACAIGSAHDVPQRAQECLRLPGGGVRPFSPLARIGGCDETAVEDGFDRGTDRVVDDAVAERRGANGPLF